MYYYEFRGVRYQLSGKQFTILFPLILIIIVGLAILICTGLYKLGGILLPIAYIILIGEVTIDHTRHAIIRNERIRNLIAYVLGLIGLIYFFI